MTATYPRRREATIVLRDGSALAVLLVRPDNESDLARFFTDLSMESPVPRFFAAVANADALAKKMVAVDQTPSGLVATTSTTRVMTSSPFASTTGGALQDNEPSSGWACRALLKSL